MSIYFPPSTTFASLKQTLKAAQEAARKEFVGWQDVWKGPEMITPMEEMQLLHKKIVEIFQKDLEFVQQCEEDCNTLENRESDSKTNSSGCFGIEAEHHSSVLPGVLETVQSDLENAEGLAQQIAAIAQKAQSTIPTTLKQQLAQNEACFEMMCAKLSTSAKKEISAEQERAVVAMTQRVLASFLECRGLIQAYDTKNSAGSLDVLEGGKNRARIAACKQLSSQVTQLFDEASLIVLQIKKITKLPILYSQTGIPAQVQSDAPTQSSTNGQAAVSSAQAHFSDAYKGRS